MESEKSNLRISSKIYSWQDLMFRQDNQTRELCLFTCDIQKGEEGKIYVKETNVKNPENVIQWIGTCLPVRPRWAKKYINKSDYERYGAICHRTEVFEEYVGTYDENGLYTEDELIALINSINIKRDIKLNIKRNENIEEEEDR